MVARVKTVAFQGIDCLEVDVEVQAAPGLPAFTVVGLPDKVVGEMQELEMPRPATVWISLGCFSASPATNGSIGRAANEPLSFRIGSLELQSKRLSVGTHRIHTKDVSVMETFSDLQTTRGSISGRRIRLS
jgi:hypothetical protein